VELSLGESMKKYVVFLLPILLSITSINAEGGYLTGLNWWGPFIGFIILCAIGIVALIVIIKYRTFFMKLFVATIFGGCGATIGMIFLPEHTAALSIILFIFGYWVSSKVLKMQGNKLAYVNTGRRSEYDDSDFDDDFDSGFDDFGGDD